MPRCLSTLLPNLTRKIKLSAGVVVPALFYVCPNCVLLASDITVQVNNIINDSLFGADIIENAALAANIK